MVSTGSHGDVASPVITLSEHHFSPDAVTDETITEFQQIIYGYYQQHQRKFPWRETADPYAIVVSEIMLQQTQTDRVIPKYTAFLRAFPNFHMLHSASFEEVLTVWHGLGYNRRARALKAIADQVVTIYHGVLPTDQNELMKLSGIGPYTAAAICAFAYNQPVILIETNIRTVFLHFFFRGKHHISDKQLLPLITQTLDTTHPRTWYYALMDYGVMLKTRFPNPSRRSAHYYKQTPFSGSTRQLRGQILAVILKAPGVSLDELTILLTTSPIKIKMICDQLVKEGLITVRDHKYYIAY
jgi:A/G-specific adenine glycosylase